MTTEAGLPIIALLRAMRANAAAVVASCDAMLEECGALAPPPAPAVAATDGDCLHPPEQRITAPRMGAPGAWTCGLCGTEGGA